MLRALFALFGCQHRHIGWPRTHGKVTTVQCHDCKRRVDYDLTEMRVSARVRQRAPERATEEVARG